MGGSASKPDDQISADLRTDEELLRSNYPSSTGHTITLSRSDRGPSRTLGYALYGATEPGTARHAIVFFHGTPGTRFFFTEGHAAHARQHGVIVIVPERPGFGLSTPSPTRTLRSTANDTARLLDILHISHVHAVGYSAGGPYALAFAHEEAKRCLSLSVISSLSPNVGGITRGMTLKSRVGYTCAARAPRMLSLLVHGGVRPALRDVYAPGMSDFTDSENELFASREDIRRTFAKSMLELYSRPCGADAECEDYVLMARDWGFRLSDIDGGFPIGVYTGSDDNKCTMGMFRTLVDQLPAKRVRQVIADGENHLYFFKMFEERLFYDLGIIITGTEN